MNKEPGPTVKVFEFCKECPWCKLEAEGEGSPNVFVVCAEPHKAKRNIGWNTWKTPKWCPAKVGKLSLNKLKDKIIAVGEELERKEHNDPFVGESFLNQRTTTDLRKEKETLMDELFKRIEAGDL